MKKSLVIIVIITFSIFIGFRMLKPASFNMSNVFSKKTEIKVDKQNESNELKSPTVSTLFRFKGIPVIVEKNQITIGYEGGETSHPVFSITDKDYPDLFYKLDESSRIQVDGVSDSKNKNDYIVISRESFGPGSYMLASFIIVDINTKKVLFKSPKTFATRFSTYKFNSDGSEISMEWNPYYFSSGVVSTMVPILEYHAYDRKDKKFVISNARHAEDFKALLDRLDQRESDCFYYRKKMNVKNIIAEYGADKKCDDYLMPNTPKFNSDYFISVGEFETLRNNIKKIIHGENISVISDKPDVFPEPWGFSTCRKEDQDEVLEKSKKESLFSKHPELADYIMGHCVFLVDVSEFITGSDPVTIFQSYPVGCGSCGTRTVDYMYKGLIETIDVGHEIQHQLMKQKNGLEILQITYGLLEPGDTNSNYKLSVVKEYKWDDQKENFIKISEKTEPSPYSKQ